MTEQTIHHLIFGAGLVGGYLAGSFLHRGARVSVVGRDHALERMQDGISLSDYHGHSASTLAPNTNVDERSHVDVLWLTVKCTAVEASVEDLKSVLSEDTIIVCCQNGFGSDAPLREALPNNIILTSFVGFNVTFSDEGTFHRTTEGELVLELSPLTERCCSSLASELLPIRTSSNILAERWAKLQLNLSNAINALSDIPVKPMLETHGYRKVIAAAMRELLSVANAKGLELPKLTALPAHWLPSLMCLPDWLYKTIAAKTLTIDSTARASMWWDVKGKKRTEIDYLNAAVVCQGKALGIDCPVNTAIVDTIHALERGDIKMGMSADDMVRLLL